jgi:hypothetical protein
MKKKILSKYSFSLVLIIILSGLFSIVSSCGGGGGGGSTPVAKPPLIEALLFSFPAGSEPPNFQNAMVAVIDGSSGGNITTATVTMNGLILTYHAMHQQYEGNVAVDPGGSIALSVTVGGNTYTASGTQFTFYPTISAPVWGATYSRSSPIRVAWSGGAPTTNAVYLLGVLDVADPNGGNAFFKAISILTTSYSILENSLTPGDHLVILGIMTLEYIPNAAPDSAFVFGGFNYVPITIN